VADGPAADMPGPTDVEVMALMVAPTPMDWSANRFAVLAGLSGSQEAELRDVSAMPMDCDEVKEQAKPLSKRTRRRGRPVSNLDALNDWAQTMSAATESAALVVAAAPAPFQPSQPSQPSQRARKRAQVQAMGKHASSAGGPGP